MLVFDGRHHGETPTDGLGLNSREGSLALQLLCRAWSGSPGQT